MDKFLNFYTKYPWVAIIIIAQWTATVFFAVYAVNVNLTNVLGITFLSTVIYAYFGFKIPKT